jgi:HlyD family secretion protein
MTVDNEKWSARRPMILGILGVIVLVGGFGGWAATTNISGAIIAPGRIEVDQNRQIIQHPTGGVVAKINVDEGDEVEAFAILAELDATELVSALSIAESQLYELLARRGRLEAERDGEARITFDPLLLEAAETNGDAAELIAGQERLLEARAASVAQEIDQLAKRSDQIRDQITGIEAQRAAITRQTELLAEELEDQQSLLDRGLAQQSRVLALRREEARLTGLEGELRAQKAQAEGRITEIEVEILKLETLRREEAITTLRDLQYRELEQREKRNALVGEIERLKIRAPVSGIIYGLRIFALRSVVRPAEPIAFIVPQDRPLVINARVEPIHIDKIYLSQDVTLRFSSLDQRRTPELTGRVTHISADAFQDEATQQSYYRAEIVLSEGEQARLPEGTTLIPGMPVEAFIRTEDRTPLDFLVRPLTDYFAKAFRE